MGALRWGTSHFVTDEGAIRYYAQYDTPKPMVMKMIEDGVISIGMPSFDPNKERIVLIDNGVRYAIEEVGRR